MIEKSALLTNSLAIYRRREFSVNFLADTHHSVAETKDWTIEEATRAMLEDKDMSKFYWAEAVRTAVYL